MQPINKLKQKAFLRSVSVLLYTDHLYYNARTYGQFAETKIDYEDLRFETTKRAKVDYWSLILGGGLMLSIASVLVVALFNPDEIENSTASWMFRLLMFTIGFALFITARTTTVFLHTYTGRHIGLMAYNPSIETVQSFIQTVHATARDYVVTKHANPDNSASPQEYRVKLEYLLENKYLSQQEFDSHLVAAGHNKVVVKGFGKG